jgi:hypothetical protein
MRLHQIGPPLVIQKAFNRNLGIYCCNTKNKNGSAEVFCAVVLVLYIALQRAYARTSHYIVINVE